uniref:SUI1 domain-containing protein n=1 Tax=Romanomermis culicivorax TaxID=13658 RepID=A0A915JDH1_ROMCU
AYFNNHQAFRDPQAADKAELALPSSSELVPNTKNTDFKEMLSLPNCLLPLIRLYKPDAKKGDAYPATEIRRMATEYVRKEQLVAAGQPPRVRLDALLAACTNRKIAEEFTWPKFFEYLMAQLNPCYEFNFSDGSSGIKKGRPPVLVIQTVKRAGNKNVILINHAACFNIDCDQLCKDLRVAMAASSTLNTEIHTLASTGPQVIVQGNNVAVVANLLREKYNVPKTAIKILHLRVSKSKEKISLHSAEKI